MEEHWFMLGKVASQQNIELLRQSGQLAHFAAYSDAEFWEKVEAMQNTTEIEADAPPLSLKAPEWKVLSNPALAPSARDFKVTAVPPPPGYEHVLKQVVLVERLREARALVGFTRIESPGDFAEVTEFPEERRVPLSRKRPTWVPAAAVRGEGIFLEFREDTLRNWLDGRAQHLHNRTFREAHTQWRKARHLESPEAGYPGLRYVLLHSFAHALMRQLTLECGHYPSSAIVA